jgi:hypothetical protein
MRVICRGEREVCGGRDVGGREKEQEEEEEDKTEKERKENQCCGPTQSLSVVTVSGKWGQTSPVLKLSKWFCCGARLCFLHWKQQK